MNVTRKKGEDKMKEAAKGRVQEQIVFDLEKYGKSKKLKNYMKSQGYYSSYCKSFHNLTKRLQELGYNAKIKPGKLGGDWTARIVIE